MQLSSNVVPDFRSNDQAFELVPGLAAPCLGHSAIVRLAYAGADLSSLTRSLVLRVQGPLVDPGALLDLATLLICQGGDLAVEGHLMQRNAIAMQKTYEITHGNGTGLRVLAFVTAGDFMVNTPLDFLLHRSDLRLILHFVDAHTRDLTDVPAHDVAFMAIGESPETAAVLARIGDLLADWSVPCFNAAAWRVAAMARDQVSRLLSGEPSLLVPHTRRIARPDLVRALMNGPKDAFGLTYPMVVRPVGSHAGAGMQRVADGGDLAAWLRQSNAAQVYLAPFIDYRGADGLYAKQRIVMIKGQAFASHMASSTHWMVHYLNADMAENPDRRATEAAWMANFDHDFAHRHAGAFAAIYRMVGLDYFGFDCAELPDGRLLIFEVDVAMIVHDMDSPEVFPYKKPVMQKLFSGFVTALEQAAGKLAGG